VGDASGHVPVTSSTVTATIVFTDIVGSTALMGRIGEEKAEHLRREHFDLLSEAIDAHDGRLVKTLGDGIMAVFDGAMPALAFAVAAQQAMQRRTMNPDVEPIQIRVALCAGECDVVDGDYFGPTVVQAARLCAAAEPDQILVSDMVRMLAGSRGGFEFSSPESRELKGITEPVAVSVLQWPPAADEPVAEVVFPPRLGVGSPFAFVGRIDERQHLEDAWKHVVAGGRRTVLLSGEPGVGKTTLAGSFAHARHDEGALVVYGRCDEDLGIPYQPWVEVFSFLAQNDHHGLIRALGDRVHELAPFVPTLASEGSPHTVDQASERFSLFATVADAVRELGVAQPMLLVLDDLQWADRPTLQLLRHLLTATPPCRCLILGTFRDSEIDDQHPLADLLATLHRDNDVDRVALTGLADGDLVDLLASAAGHELPEEGITLAHALNRETNGNPFFAIEILRHLAETGFIARSDSGLWQSTATVLDQGLPVSVREVVGRRVARLGEDVGRVLRAASVIGREFDLALLAEVVDLSEEATLDLLEYAVLADLVEDLTPGTFGFVHALVEHALYDGLAPTRRARLHHRVAEILEVIAPDERLAELAYHWSEATTPRDATKAIAAAKRAGDHALAALAPDEARRWYSRALDLLEPPNRETTMGCDLLAGLAEAQRQLASPDYRDTFFEAARVADILGDRERLVQIALANGRHTFSWFGDVDLERVQLLHRALDAVGDSDPGRRAQLLGRLASELTYAATHEERNAAAAEAVTLARQLGDDQTLLHVLLARGDTITSPTLTDERRELGYAALELAEAQADNIAIFLACEVLYDTAWATGDLTLADAMLQRLTAIAERLAQAELRWPTRWREAERSIVAGDLVLADTLSIEAFEIGTEAGHPDALIFHLGQLCVIRHMQGRLHELMDLFDELIATAPPVPIQDAIYATGCVAAGRSADAAGWLTDRIEALPRLPLDEQWTFTMAMWCRTAGAVGDDAAAAVLFDLIWPWRHLFAHSGVAVAGPMSLYAGLLAGQLGRDDASDLLLEAVAAADDTRDPFHSAEARLALAVLPLTEPDAARALLREAQALIDGQQFVGLEARLLQLAEELHHHELQAE